MLKKIISGGQTGVDRAALDSVRKNAPYSWGGWAPRGRICEEPGGIPDEYFTPDRPNSGMQEAESSRYRERTVWNIRDSDATLILRTGNVLGPGTKLTIKMLRQKEKIYRICDPYRIYTVPRVVQWIVESRADENEQHRDDERPDRGIEILNVAGSRESKNPGVYARSFQFLTDIWHFVFMYERWGIKIWDPKRSNLSR